MTGCGIWKTLKSTASKERVFVSIMIESSLPSIACP